MLWMETGSLFSTSVDNTVMLFAANRQELDISLLAEPSSDEDEELATKRRKSRRRKPASARAVDSKADIRLLTTETCSDQAADSKFIPPAKTRKRMKSLCESSLIIVLIINTFV